MSRNALSSHWCRFYAVKILEIQAGASSVHVRQNTTDIRLKKAWIFMRFQRLFFMPVLFIISSNGAAVSTHVHIFPLLTWVPMTCNLQFLISWWPSTWPVGESKPSLWARRDKPWRFQIVRAVVVRKGLVECVLRKCSWVLSVRFQQLAFPFAVFFPPLLLPLPSCGSNKAVAAMSHIPWKKEARA